MARGQLVHFGWWVSLGPVTRLQSERCPSEPGWVLLEGLESLTGRGGCEEGRAGQGVGPLCWEVVLLRGMRHPLQHLLEYCLIYILFGKGAVCIILEPLVPNLVQNPQYYFSFCDIVLSFQKQAPCLHLERTRWGSWASATRQTRSQVLHRYHAPYSALTAFCFSLRLCSIS